MQRWCKNTSFHVVRLTTIDTRKLSKYIAKYKNDILTCMCSILVPNFSIVKDNQRSYHINPGSYRTVILLLCFVIRSVYSPGGRVSKTYLPGC